jgi:hypothetical protein
MGGLARYIPKSKKRASAPRVESQLLGFKEKPPITQVLAEFEGKNGRPCNTCAKCREKGRKNDHKTARKEYHTELQKERGKDYNAKHREKVKNGDDEKEHNLDQKCNWAKSEKTKDRAESQIGNDSMFMTGLGVSNVLPPSKESNGTFPTPRLNS